MKIDFKKSKKLLEKKKGFTLALIFTIIILILTPIFIFSPDQNFEKKMETENLYLETKMYLEQTSTTLENDPYEYTDLDKAYINSVKKDLEWLKKKNTEIYMKKNYERLVAFKLFKDYLLKIDESMAYDFEYDKNSTIENALQKEFVKVPLVDMNNSEEEARVVSSFVSSIEKDFFNELKERIYSTKEINKKFVEAKKIIFLFYN